MFHHLKDVSDVMYMMKWDHQIQINMDACARASRVGRYCVVTQSPKFCCPQILKKNKYNRKHDFTPAFEFAWVVQVKTESLTESAAKAIPTRLSALKTKSMKLIMATKVRRAERFSSRLKESLARDFGRSAGSVRCLIHSDVLGCVSMAFFF